MAKSVRIDRNQKLHPSQDYPFLHEEGIRLAQQFSESAWTDYNHHDPGVTILEYLCFGITDLGYRASFPVTDLLYAKDSVRMVPEGNAFYPPEKILPSAALSINDYRRLIIDQISEVQNVWVNPVVEFQEKHKGLFDIQLQLNHEDSSIYPEEIKNKVTTLLSKNRNLGEDFRNIQILKQEYLDLQLEIDLLQDASAEQVLATIIHELEHFLNPHIRFKSIEEKLAAGEDINTLLDGPRLSHGYIEPGALHNAPSSVYKSQLQNTILKQAGVKAIKVFTIIRNGFVYEQEEIAILPNTYFLLSKALKEWGDVNPDRYPIKFTRNNYRVNPDLNLAEQNYKVFLAHDIQYLTHQLNLNKTPKSEKKLADIAAYYSIQRFFPAVYGLGNYGLSRDADTLRQAQSRQMKGYLAIFETLMASYLKQLSEVKSLFSIEKFDEKPNDQKGVDENVIDLAAELERATQLETQPIYPFQFPKDIPDIEPLIADLAERKAMQPGEKDATLFLQRCNTFLDHLLARFGESFQGDWLYKFLNNPEDLVSVQNRLVITKLRILQEYEQLSRERGLGFDYRVAHIDRTKKLRWQGSETPTWSSNHVSGFKKRLSYWLNRHSYTDRSLTNFFPFTDFELHQEQPTSSNSDDNRGIPFEALLEFGRSKDQYKIEKKKELFEVLFNDNQSGKPVAVFKTDNENAAKQFLYQFVKSVNAFDEYCKGFFVVEHILLRSLRERGSILELHVKGEEKNKPEAFPIFNSLRYSPLNELNDIANELISIASNKANYELVAEGGEFFITIKQDWLPILMSREKYPEKEAYECINQVQQKFHSILSFSPKAGEPASEVSPISTINEWININKEPEWDRTVKINDKDFYAHKISIVVPNWPSVFKESGFQTLFHEMVVQHLPAHLKANIHWLNWKEMQDFEKIYCEWLEAKSNEASTLDEQDEKAAKLIQLLNKQAVASDEPRQKLLSRDRFDAIFSNIRYLLLEPVDLQIIDGIDAKVEYFLKKGNIRDWYALSYSSPDELERILRDAGLNDQIALIDSWISQAKTAIAQQWEALKKLQPTNKSGETQLDNFTSRKSKSIFGYSFNQA